jgi:ABC-type Na+ efflux pump permease subunit
MPNLADKETWVAIMYIVLFFAALLIGVPFVIAMAMTGVASALESARVDKRVAAAHQKAQRRKPVILAYFNVWNRHELMEMVGSDEWPRVGGTVTFSAGDNEGTWRICGINSKVKNEMYDGAVFVDKE